MNEFPVFPWLNTDDASAYLSMSPGTLRNWRSVGTGPKYYVVGKFVRYNVHDLDDWMMRQAA